MIGYDEGTIMVKLGREEPVASMDNSGKIIWAKHNEIQTVNIRSVGADVEVWAHFYLFLSVGIKHNTKEFTTLTQHFKHNMLNRWS